MRRRELAKNREAAAVAGVDAKVADGSVDRGLYVRVSAVAIKRYGALRFTRSRVERRERDRLTRIINCCFKVIEHLGADEALHIDARSGMESTVRQRDNNCRLIGKLRAAGRHRSDIGERCLDARVADAADLCAPATLNRELLSSLRC